MPTSDNLSPSSILAFFRDAPWLNRRSLRLYPRILLAVFTLAAIAWLIASAGLRDPHGHPIGADFIDPYAASWLALHDQPAAVYDVQRLWAVESAATYRGVGYAGFHYPPTYLLIILPLAAMPYAWSLLLWTVVTLALYAATMRLIDRDRDADALWLALAFPGAFVNLTSGQNGFLTLALLAAACSRSIRGRFSPACCSA
ncbi:MAG: glycosyltransferase family 87 protein [Candidatus Binatus sp.]|nr:glycosyltransferase family 87 protein [Candidatus Binatus sp.]MDO8433056.1 glycosyltransferase family 87 protein [Candidatus Binatus sp.]